MKEEPEETIMIGTNRDLKAIGDALDAEIFHLTTLKAMASCGGDIDYLDDKLWLLARERRAVSVALANRQIEAMRNLVSFARWVSGNGALDNFGDRLPAHRKPARFFAHRGRS
jgi:hypothetical protein